MTLPANITLEQLRIRYQDGRHNRPYAVLRAIYEYDITFVECMRSGAFQRAIAEGARIRAKAARRFRKHSGFIIQHVLGLEAEAFERMGDKEKAVESLRKRLSRRACVGRFRFYSYWRLGELQLSLGRRSVAMASYKKALRYAPTTETEIIQDVRSRLREIEQRRRR